MHAIFRGLPHLLGPGGNPGVKALCDPPSHRMQHRTGRTSAGRGSMILRGRTAANPPEQSLTGENVGATGVAHLPISDMDTTSTASTEAEDTGTTFGHAGIHRAGPTPQSSGVGPILRVVPLGQHQVAADSESTVSSA